MVTNALFNKPIYIHSKVPPYRFVSKSEYREFMSFQACNNCRYKQILEWKLKRFIECILRNRHSSRDRCENKSINKLQCFSLANMPLYCHGKPWNPILGRFIGVWGPFLFWLCRLKEDATEISTPLTNLARFIYGFRCVRGKLLFVWANLVHWRSTVITSYLYFV